MIFHHNTQTTDARISFWYQINSTTVQIRFLHSQPFMNYFHFLINVAYPKIRRMHRCSRGLCWIIVILQWN